MKYFLIFSLSLLYSLNLIAESNSKDKQENESRLVTITIIDTGEKESIALKSHQSAQVKVILASLGDMLDEYMVTLTDLNKQSVVGNSISDSTGEVVFRKVLPGNYAVYLNKKVVTEEQELSSVKVSDVILKAYP